ncbi:MAG: carboxylating nicotinate-nucleotide diphosphorylase, partial [Fibrobacter sp.]|nr:carboxylating nicotinate-nucleotide diphosphorylase [Fibrobacter sp.]
LGNAGDITSDAIFDKSDLAEAVIKSKATGVLSGAYILKPLFAKVNSGVVVDIKAADGQKLQPGTIICTLKGSVTGILAGERIALNLLQRLSGIATAASKIVSEICHTSTRLLDTRKTTPGLRLLEKKAVVHGGGSNHRFGLFDMILIKDTHVKRSGGVGNALKKALDYRESRMQNVKIEVEVQSIEEFHEALAYKADRIMLDNMNVDKMKSCVDYIRNNNINVELEASGNITAETARQIASCGVDFISSGAITHSAPALDIHLVIL